MRTIRLRRFFEVSIHAPAWGATASGTDDFRSDTVSIHAPAWGATPRRQPPPIPQSRFQSTHPRGVRQGGQDFMRYPPFVSIHAPAWGATLNAGNGTEGHFMFQSTHPRGVRHTAGPLSSKPALFQSTHPRGVRLADVGQQPALPFGFNPRTRVGCDIFTGQALVGIVQFQSTHPRGVRRQLDGQALLALGVSIHAPAWGAT